MEAQTVTGNATSVAPVVLDVSKETVVAPKAEPAKPASAASTVSESPKVETPKPRMLGEDDEPGPDDKELTLSAEAFKKRMERGNKRYLREVFGTDDPKALKERLTKLETLEAKEEEARRAAMDEKTRLEEDLRKERQKSVMAEQRAREIEDDHLAERQDAMIEKIAIQHIKPKFYKYAGPEFAQYLQDKFNESEMRDFGEAKIAKWFEEFAKENPEWAHTKEEPRGEVKVAPIMNGKSTNEKPTPLPSGKTEGKTPSPGKANSMSKQEWEAYKRQKGIAY